MFWVFQSKASYALDSLVSKDKILQGNTCLKMIYKSLEYYYISINFSPKVQLLSYNGKLNQIVLQTSWTT